MKEKEKYAVGTKHMTKEGHEMEIIEKLKNGRRMVRFEDGYEVDTTLTSISKGCTYNPYSPSVYNIGYFGVGKYKSSINKNHTIDYKVWGSMFQRCYSNIFQEKQPAYKGATVCKEWHNFQNFAKWYEENCPRIEGEKFQLDKDLLQHDVKNKIYSPSTCIFLPQKVNIFLANNQTSNTSGFVGVSWDKSSKKWRAQSCLFGKNTRIYLGVFSTPEEASEAYKKAREIEAEKVKDYLRSLNYLSENIIQLIK